MREHFSSDCRTPPEELSLPPAKYHRLRAHRQRMDRPCRREKYKKDRRKTEGLHRSSKGGGCERVTWDRETVSRLQVFDSDNKTVTNAPTRQYQREVAPSRRRRISASIASTCLTARGQVKCVRTRCRAADPKLERRLADASRRIAERSSSGSRPSTSSPVAPSSTASGTPPERPPITGLPHAAASRNTMPKPSKSPPSTRFGWTKISAAA